MFIQLKHKSLNVYSLVRELVKRYTVSLFIAGQREIQYGTADP
jgi:hypothetical protein